MLQISTGKFYDSVEPENLHLRIHRGILYTNYELQELLSTPIGSLFPAVRWSDQQTVICEINERLPKLQGKIAQGKIASVGPDPYINDFSALVSFYLNIVCTPDKELANRLLIAQKAPLGIPALPKKYIPKIFDKYVRAAQTDGTNFASFASSLVALERKRYVGVMRAIRRFVMAMHRISDDLDLAYALLVAAIESLAQEFDEFIPEWVDYNQEKRVALDNALRDAPEAIAIGVRGAILKYEHAALGRQYLEFSLKHLKPSFFREEALLECEPAGRAEIRLGLKNAYQLRSEYVHALQPIPKNLKNPTWYADIERVDDRSYLTFHGLARVARHVILSFVSDSPKVERESYDYVKDYPTVTRHSLSPHFWLSSAHIYNEDLAARHLSGFLQEIGFSYSTGCTHPISNLTDVKLKIEKLLPKIKKSELLPMLTTYVIYSYFFRSDEKRSKSFITPYISNFDDPTIFSLLARFIVAEQSLPWSDDQIDKLLVDYQTQRFHKKGIDAGSVVSAALTLWIAEYFRAKGNEDRARMLIREAVEEYPKEKGLLDLEKHAPQFPLPKIEHWLLIAPKLSTANKSA